MDRHVQQLSKAVKEQILEREENLVSTHASIGCGVAGIQLGTFARPLAGLGGNWKDVRLLELKGWVTHWSLGETTGLTDTQVQERLLSPRSELPQKCREMIDWEEMRGRQGLRARKIWVRLTQLCGLAIESSLVRLPICEAEHVHDIHLFSSVDTMFRDSPGHHHTACILCKVAAARGDNSTVSLVHALYERVLLAADGRSWRSHSSVQMKLFLLLVTRVVTYNVLNRLRDVSNEIDAHVIGLSGTRLPFYRPWDGSAQRSPVANHGRHFEVRWRYEQTRCSNMTAWMWILANKKLWKPKNVVRMFDAPPRLQGGAGRHGDGAVLGTEATGYEQSSELR